MSDIVNQDSAQWREASRWFSKALEDVRSAVVILAVDPPLLDPAAYHCQQASEKLMKGLLVASGQVIPKTHDLLKLSALVLPFFPSLKEDVDAVSDMTPWGTVTRYPDLDCEHGILTQDIQEALLNLDKLYASIIALTPSPM